MKNKKGQTNKERFRDVLSDPNNKYIPRVKNAGKVIDGHIVMHNGLLINDKSYYKDLSDVFKLNNGVHEPQEERVFMEVLKDIPKGGTMIELGAYWSFYSMWFNKNIEDAKNYMVEQSADYLRIGKKHFELNNMEGDFTVASIGKNGINIDGFIKEKNIKFIDILHSDIQGSELEMLKGAKDSLSGGIIKYIFISTHSQDLHYSCLNFLKDNGYAIIASADFDNETFCYDGVLVARQKKLKGVSPMDIGNRSATKLITQKEFEEKYNKL